MKKTFACVTIVLAGVWVAQAGGSFSFGFSFGSPGVSFSMWSAPPVACAPRPVVYVPPPVYVPAAPVAVCAPVRPACFPVARVYAAPPPAPVYVPIPAPVYVAPRPLCAPRMVAAVPAPYLPRPMVYPHGSRHGARHHSH